MRRNTFFVTVLVVSMGFALNCGGDDGKNNPAGGGNGNTPGFIAGTFRDGRDGQTYKTVKIGSQTWTAQNLNYLPDIMRGNDGFTDSSWCYGNLESNCAKYGRLYTWYGAHGACPEGWRLPTWTDWKDLVIQLGGFYGETTGKKLKSKTGWDENGNGTDDIGFGALPGGRYDMCPECGHFYGVGKYGIWWGTNTPEDERRPSRLRLSYEDDQADLDVYGLGGVSSVRCIKK